MTRSAIGVGYQLVVGSLAAVAAPADERPLYVAAANTLAGVLTFAFIAFGVFAQVIGIDATLTVLLILGLLGAASAWRMPEASRMTATE